MYDGHWGGVPTYIEDSGSFGATATGMQHSHVLMGEGHAAGSSWGADPELEGHAAGSSWGADPELAPIAFGKDGKSPFASDGGGQTYANGGVGGAGGGFDVGQFSSVLAGIGAFSESIARIIQSGQLQAAAQQGDPAAQQMLLELQAAQASGGLDAGRIAQIEAQNAALIQALQQQQQSGPMDNPLVVGGLTIGGLLLLAGVVTAMARR